MTLRRPLALTGLGLLALLLVVVLVGPRLLRGPVERAVRDRIGRAVDARVEWRGAGLGLVRDFPNATLRLDDLSVTGVGRFEGDTLLSVARARVVLDLVSVLRSLRGAAPVVVRAVELQEPRARLVVLEDGTANWDVARPAGADAGSAGPASDATDGDSPVATPGGRALTVSLRGVEVRDGVVRLENRQANLDVTLAGLRESLRGDFGARRFTLSTRTTADTFAVSLAGVPWLPGARLDLAADVDVDLSERRVTLSENEIHLNDLVLRARGSVADAGDSLAVDVAFDAPEAGFADILSLVPALHSRGLATLETSGTVRVDGTVRGGWGEGTFPALAMGATVEHGMFRYPDLPLPARDVALGVRVDNPGGDADRTVLTVDPAHVVVGDDPLDGALVLRTPLSDPDVAVRVRGRLDLADLARTVKLEGMDEVGGVVEADAHMRARRSDAEGRRYEAMDAGGQLGVTDLSLRGGPLPHPLQLEEAALRLSPRQAELTSLRGTVGRSDVDAAGRLDNLLGFVLHGQELRGEARVRSGFVDLEEWRSGGAVRAVPVPAGVDFTLQAVVDRVAFADLDLRNARGTLRVKDRRVTLDGFDVEMLGGAVSMSGFYETTDPTRPTFDVDVEARDLDVPRAFEGLRTVRLFAPVARYARGRFSTDLELRGALGEDLVPIPQVLSGLGSLRTRGVEIRDFPAFDRLADALRLDLLRDPALRDLASTIEIRDGRLHVRPFEMTLGPVAANVSGSNGFDQSLDYTLRLDVPRALLGAAADRVVADLVSRAGRAGVDLQTADVIPVDVHLTGTVSDPSVTTGLRGAAASAAAGVGEAVRAEVESRVDSAVQRLDETASEEEARARARLVAEAETRAATIRSEARSLADAVRSEGRARADSLVARATNPAAQIAARAAADRLLRETDARADRMVREADARADSLVAAARRGELPPDSAAAGAAREAGDSVGAGRDTASASAGGD